jgi:uncharacterized protein YkwD
MASVRDCGNCVSVNGAKTVRLLVALAVVAASGLLTASALATGHSERSMQTLNRQILAAVNAFRARHGLVPLRESRGLDSSARQHSLEMGRLGYFAHSSADGASFWQRIQHYYPSRSFEQWSVGENLLWEAPSISAGKALNLWIASPEHLRKLLAPQWRQMGVSAVHVVDAPGVFHGLPVTIITTDFGVRR